MGTVVDRTENIRVFSKALNASMGLDAESQLFTAQNEIKQLQKSLHIQKENVKVLRAGCAQSMATSQIVIEILMEKLGASFDETRTMIIEHPKNTLYANSVIDALMNKNVPDEIADKGMLETARYIINRDVKKTA